MIRQSYSGAGGAANLHEKRRGRVISLLCLSAVFASFLPPPFYVGCVMILSAFLLVYRGARISPPMPQGTAVILILFLFFAVVAAIGPTLNYGGGTQNIDALKFLFATASFAIGLTLGVENDKLPQGLPIFLGAITFYYASIYFTDAGLDQEALVYPPDYNNSAYMLAIFLPLIILNLKGHKRSLCLALLFAFSIFVASRSLLGVMLIASALSFENVRKQRLLMGLTVTLGAFLLFYRNFSLDNFSDFARLRIIDQSLHYALNDGANAFNFGEDAFRKYLNLSTGIRNLDIQHAHNMLLQIWSAYGLVPLIAFGVFLIAFGANAWRQRNYLCLGSLTIFLVLGMFESQITDIRAFGTMIFVLGYTYSCGRKVRLAGGSSRLRAFDAPSRFYRSSAHLR